MKKLSTIIIALSLVLSLTQCKKTETPTEGWVHITMKVDGGDRHIVYPSTGAVMYSEGDIVYVGNNNHYIGYLTFHDGTFSGDIYNPSSSDYLHFYFLGGKNPESTLNAGESANTFVSIANQDDKLPVLSYGHSKNKYDANNVDYYCLLRNKCALVKFNLPFATNNTVSVKNLPIFASINFADPDNPIVALENKTDITLYSQNGTEKWAILLPGSNITSSSLAVVGSTEYTITVTDPVQITNNAYIDEGITINYQPAAPEGAINSFFSIADGQTVYFSKGNLQASTTDYGANWTWSFAEEQYGFIGNSPANSGVNGAMSVSANGPVDLFGWNGASSSIDHYGIHNATTNSAYGNVNGENLKHDWGHNPINNGGNVADTWYTLSSQEWEYLLNTRSTTSGLRYAKATVNGVNGVILIPDNWNTSTYSFNNTNTNDASYDSNIISDSQWTTMKNTVVFLPAAGYRTGNEVEDDNSIGYYWSRTSMQSKLNPYFITFNDSYLETDNAKRGLGHAVRLVRNVE